MLHPIALPTDLFQVAAVCAGKPLSHEAGTNVAQKVKQALLSENDKQNLYVQEVMQLVPDKVNSLISNSYELKYEDVDNSYYDFSYTDDTLRVKQQKYSKLSGYRFIHPDDLILNFYYFPHLEVFTQLIPEAVKLWSEQDNRVIEMKRTANLIAKADSALQSITVLHNHSTSEDSDLYVDNHFALIEIPPILYDGDLETDDDFLSTDELRKFFEKGLKISEELIVNIQKPIVKDEGWLAALRVRNNHFRSAYDIFVRVLLPIANICSKKHSNNLSKITSKNSLTTYDGACLDVFIVESDRTTPIYPAAFIVIGDKFVPVFINEEESYEPQLDTSQLKLYKSKSQSGDYSISKLDSQPFYGKQPEDLLYLQLDTEGISVNSFNGDRHLRVTYAKLTEKTLADIFREFTGED
jgi:hypothetical protein